MKEFIFKIINQEIMKDFIIKKINSESDNQKLIKIMDILDVKNEYDKIKNCKHKFKYLFGSPQNETHQCVNCGIIG
jgi:hypothetical protein